MESTAGSLETAREVVATRNDGRIKMHLTWKALCFRRDNRELFESGRYLPLEVEGACIDHVCAFERSVNGSSVLVVVPRLCSRLMAGNGSLPLGQELWQDTRVIQPFDTASSCYRNVFTGEILTLDQREGLLTLALKDIFSVYPVAMLERIGRTGETA